MGSCLDGKVLCSFDCDDRSGSGCRMQIALFVRLPCGSRAAPFCRLAPDGYLESDGIVFAVVGEFEEVVAVVDLDREAL